MVKKLAISAAAGAVAYYLLGKFVIKNENGGGFVPMSDGFGLDDVVLGGGTVVIAGLIAHMVG